MDTGTIASGVDSDGTKYLQLFLIEYTKLFPGTVNPSCNKCLSDYVTKYKKAMSTNKLHPENSGYKLKAMYEGIALEFGSQIFVTNENLTDEYAKTLLSHDDGQRFFLDIPEAVELTGRDKLQADYDDALKAFEGLKEKTHHATKKKVETALEAAKEALAKYDAENPVEEIEATADDTDVNGASVNELLVTDPENVE